MKSDRFKMWMLLTFLLMIFIVLNIDIHRENYRVRMRTCKSEFDYSITSYTLRPINPKSDLFNYTYEPKRKVAGYIEEI